MITETQNRWAAQFVAVLPTTLPTAFLSLAAIVVAALCCAPAAAQKIVSPQVKNAVERSEKAAKIIDTIMALPGAEGIPREVVEKAEAVAVIPHVVKVTVMFSTTTKGYGVISRRTPKGWTLPAYYGFGGGGKVASLGSGESKDIIMFFMNDKMVDYFQKGRFEFERERAANGGTVGVSIQKAVLDRANVFVYALDDGKLSGLEISNGFWTQLVLNPDNNINNVLYRMKGRDVIARKPVNAETLPEGVNAFQQALTRYSVRQ
ncbi:MAG: hypothetical protein QOF02_3057 [Blastocatellia bacterium]|jgi:lipid-binding SYLF domain-containing protein|nr:hypothetical protein [Blastocatellia bacterium]